MKKMKKMMALAIALVMCMSMMSMVAFAQNIDSGKEGSASITISNAAKGETYSVYKLFSATVTGTEDGSIAYTGPIPGSLSAYFEADSAGNISATDAVFKSGSTTELSDAAIAALKAWAATQTATAATPSTGADGSAVVFQNLEYGYYVVTTTQGDTAITVDSTNPNATIVDKNTTEPNLVSKTVDDDNVYIGQTVTYTVVFNTSNFDGAGADAKRIVSYTITDTLPNFLTDVTVTGIKVDADANTETTNDQTAITTQQFDSNGKITIPWVDGTTSLYKNGAAIIITYTAKVTDSAAIDGAGNANTVTLTWKDEDNTEHEDEDSESATIYTYALALKKVSDEGSNLAGATFEFPFYVKKNAAADGSYVYAFATLPESFETGDSADNYTNTITTPANGEITIKGLESGTAVSITETEAPQGYNKLTSAVSVTPAKTSETTTSKTWKIKDGQVVEDSVETSISATYTNESLAATPIVVINNTGTELPSTGGIGTKIFYIIGAVLVIGAGVLLVTRRRMRKE